MDSNGNEMTFKLNSSKYSDAKSTNANKKLKKYAFGLKFI